MRVAPTQPDYQQVATGAAAPGAGRAPAQAGFGLRPGLFAPYGAAPAELGGPAPAVTMNKWIYRLFIVGGVLASGSLGAWGASDSHVTELLAFSWIPFVLAGLFQCVLLYKMWKAVQDGQARVSPIAAVGLLLVPIFNLYWIFRVLPGYATDFNAYVARHRLGVPPLSQGFILAAMLVPVANVVLYWMLLGRICDGVTALGRAA
ncbi:MAG: hypothetical protein HY744_16920 [Deltaproteobacteria bacterium]|nr:hypothetical protein [Deltaproteobacteria bacterium]